MVKQVNLYEAKTNLSRLVEDAARGEEIVIAKNGKPLAVLRGVAKVSGKKRVLGQLKGKVSLGRDFDAADKEIERLFYEGDLNDQGRPFRRD